MAKKEDKSLDTDGLDDLDDLDIPELDLGMDPGNDNRDPVRKLSAGFAQGVKTDLTDHRKLPDRLKKLLPEEYESTFDLADQTTGTLGELYNTFRSETKEGVRGLKKMTRGLIDDHEDKIPEKFRERLKKLTETEERRQGPSAEQLRDDQIANSMASIFQAQTATQEDQRQEEQAERTLRDVMESHRHEGQMDLLRGMRSDLARQVSYQDQIAARWQRKSLELQYRQLFVGRDLLKLTESGVKDTKEALREIVKNTALPDYRKIQLTEAAGQEFRDAMLRKVGGGVRDWFGQLRENAVNAMRTRAQGLNNAALDVVSAREQTAGLSDLGDPMVMGGQMAGSGVATKILNKVLSMGRGKLETNERTMRGGNKLERLVRDLPQNIQEMAYSGQMVPMWVPGASSINNLIQEIIPAGGRKDTVAGGAKIEDSRSPAVFDQLTRRSIVEIIPGYLSHIHAEIQGLRGDSGGSSRGGGGGPSPDDPDNPDGGGRLEFDLHTGKFVRQDDVKASIRDNILRKEDSETTRDRLMLIMDALDPEGKLSLDERQALGIQLLEDATSGTRAFDPKRYAAGKFVDAVPEDQRTALSEFFTERFGVHTATDDKGNEKTQTAGTLETEKLQNQLSQQFSALHNETADPRQQIEAYLDVGMREHLRELGIIKADARGQETIDRAAYFQGLQSGGWDKTLTEEERLGMIGDDEERRTLKYQKEQEEKEKLAREKQAAKERFGRTTVGRAAKTVGEKARQTTQPVVDTLGRKGKSASETVARGAKSSMDYVQEQSNQIRSALKGEDPKQGLRDYLEEQTQAIKARLEEQAITPQRAREYLEQQIARTRALVESHGGMKGSVDDLLDDVRSRFEKEAIRAGERYPNVPFMPTLQAQARHATRQTGEEPQVTEQPYTTLSSPYTATPDTSYADTLAEHLTGQGFDVTSSVTPEDTAPSAKSVSDWFQDTTAVLDDQVDKAKGYVRQLQTVAEQQGWGDSAGHVVDDLKDQLRKGEDYLRQQMEQPTGALPTRESLTQQAKRLTDNVTAQAAKVKETWQNRSPLRQQDASDEESIMGRIGGVDDGDASSDVPFSGDRETGPVGSDRGHDERVAGADTVTPRRDTPLPEVVNETVIGVLKEGVFKQGELLAAVQGIQRTLDGTDETASDTDRLIEAIDNTVDTEHRETQLMLLTRIIETLEASATAKAADDPEASRSLLGRITSRTGKILRSTGKGLGRYYSGVFSGMGSIARGAGRGVGNVLGRVFSGGGKDKKRQIDVYIKDQSDPVLYAKKMRKGLYYDEETNTPIKSVGDLRKVKGNVLEIDPPTQGGEGNPPVVVLTQEEMQDGLYDRDGNDIFASGPGILSTLAKGLGSVWGAQVSLITSPFRAASAIAQRVSSFAKDQAKRPVDVYVKGEEFPRLRAVIMERGGYVDAVSGEVIDHQEKIRGAVHDLEGREVLSTADIQRGLVNHRGEDLSLSARVMGRITGAVTAPFKLAKWGMEKFTDLLQWGGGAIKDLVGGISNFFQKGVTEETGSRQLEVLEQIRDLLDERLDKPNKWDTDDDGYREGSWRERFADNKDEEERGAAGSSDTGPTKGVFGKLGALLGLGGLAGGKAKGDGEEDEDGAVDSAVDAGMGAAAYKALEKTWGGIKGGLKGIWRGGKTTVLGGGKIAAKLGGRAALTKAALWGGTALAGMMSLPALAVAGGVALAAGGGYLAYKSFTKDRAFGPLTRIRMLQYGYFEENEEAIAKIRHIEDTLAPHTHVEDNQVEVDFDKVELVALAESVGVDVEDRHQSNAFTQWLANRFYPVYLAHYAAVKALGETYSLKDVDTRLDRREKADYLNRVRSLPNVDPHPYQVKDDPFQIGGRIAVTAEDIQNAFATVAEEVIDEEDAQSERRARGFLGADLSTRTLGNIGKEDALEDWEDQEKVTGPTIIPISGNRKRHTTFTGGTIRITEAESQMVKALDAIRYKAYGLKALEERKVAALQDLENEVLEYVEYRDGRAVFDGNAEDIGDNHYTAFNLGWINWKAKREWREWFEYRFLPLFMRYLTGLKTLSDDVDAAKEALLRSPQLSLDIAQALLTTTVEVDGEDVNVWAITSKPWKWGMVNTDPSTTDDNFTVLRDAAKNKTLLEEAEKEKDETDGVADRVDGGDDPETDRTGTTINHGPSVNVSGAEALERQIDDQYNRNREANGGTSTTSSGASTTSSVGPSKTITENEGYQVLLAKMVEHGITDPNEQAMFLAQLGHESGNYTKVEEDLRYSASRIGEVFDHRISRAEAPKYAGNPEALANKVYGNRRDLGNTQPGDGWKFRGRGFIQLTGRSNYEALSAATGTDYVNDPDLILEPEHAAEASIWYWKQRAGLRSAARRGEVLTVSKIINQGNATADGSPNGLADRRARYRGALAKVGSEEYQKDVEKALAKYNAAEPSEYMADTPGKPQDLSPGEASEADRDAMLAGLAGDTRQQAGQITTPATNDRGGPATETPAAPSEGDAPISRTVGATRPSAAPEGASEARRAASQLTYVGHDTTPETETFGDEVAVERRRQQEQRVAQERDERTQREQHDSTTSLAELVNLTRQGVAHQASMDRNISSLLEVTRDSARRPEATPVPAEHTQDTTKQDLVAAARRQGRQSPSALPKGAVSVARKRYT